MCYTCEIFFIRKRDSWNISIFKFGSLITKWWILTVNVHWFGRERKNSQYYSLTYKRLTKKLENRHKKNPEFSKKFLQKKNRNSDILKTKTNIFWFFYFILSLWVGLLGVTVDNKKPVPKCSPPKIEKKYILPNYSGQKAFLFLWHCFREVTLTVPWVDPNSYVTTNNIWSQSFFLWFLRGSIIDRRRGKKVNKKRKKNNRNK